MKLSEFIAALQQRQKMHPRDDPTVVVKLSNPSIGGSAVAQVYAGFDWDNGRFFIRTEDNVVRGTAVTTEGINACAIDHANHGHEALGFEYPRRRRDAWIDGFVEGAKWGMTKLLETNNPDK